MMIRTFPLLPKGLQLKIKNRIANSEDPDETARNEYVFVFTDKESRQIYAVKCC